MHFSPKNILFCLIIFICGICQIGCVSLLSNKKISNQKGNGDFQKQYQEYQGYVRDGRAAINQGEYGKAIEHYTRAIEVSPFDAPHYYYRGVAWYKKGNGGKAIEDFNKVFILDSRCHSAYIYRGLCRMKGGEYQKALNDYQSALNLKPDDAGIYNNLAWLYATANDEKFQDVGKALEHAEKAAELSNGQSAEIMDTLAMAYFINGRIDEAIEAEKKALKLEPENQENKERLKVYEQAVKK